MNWRLIIIFFILIMFTVLTILVYRQEVDSTSLTGMIIKEDSRIVEGFAIQDLETKEVFASKDAKFIKGG